MTKFFISGIAAFLLLFVSSCGLFQPKSVGSVDSESPADEARAVLTEVELNPGCDDRLADCREWVEVTNPLDVPIYLAGWTIAATGGERNTQLDVSRTECPAELEPRQFCLFEASNWLDNEGETIMLYDGLERILGDIADLRDMDNDSRTWQWCPFTQTWEFRAPTKGQPNNC